MLLKGAVKARYCYAFNVKTVDKRFVIFHAQCTAMVIMITFGILTDLHSSRMGCQETAAILPSNEYAYVGAPHHLRAC